MSRENLHEPFSIEFKTLDECPKKGHEHNFFELVYILSGTGTQCINNNISRYHADHMFLITPEDCHAFNIETTTEFFFLLFNNIYIKENSILTDNIQRLEYILQNANHQPGCILKNKTDKGLVRPMAEAIIREYLHRDLYNRELVQHLVNTMIVVVARNIARYLPQEVDQQTDEKAMDILQYIQNNIYYPEKIRAEIISKKFGVSGSYLSRYFKNQTHETMQQYITSYRVKMIEHRLMHSNMRMGEIVTELGFTDESHLNK